MVLKISKKYQIARGARAVRSPAGTKGVHGWWHTVPTKNGIFSLTERTSLGHRLAKICYFCTRRGKNRVRVTLGYLFIGGIY